MANGVEQPRSVEGGPTSSPQPLIGAGGSAGFGAERRVVPPVPLPRTRIGVETRQGRQDEVQKEVSGPGTPRESDFAPPDPITAFVGAHTEYDENDPEAFKEALAGALRDATLVNERVAQGAQVTVRTVAGHPDVLVKLLPTYGASPEITQRIFDRRHREHEFTASYLGDFIPPTAESVIEGTGFWPQVVVQQRVPGKQFEYYEKAEATMREIAAEGVTPEQRARNTRFLEQYERMRSETGRIPECQMIQGPEGLWVVDTDGPLTLDDFIGNNRLIDDLAEEDPETVTTSRQVVDILTAHVPEFQDLAGRPWEEIRDEFRVPPNAVQRVMKATSIQHKKNAHQQNLDAFMESVPEYAHFVGKPWAYIWEEVTRPLMANRVTAYELRKGSEAGEMLRFLIDGIALFPPEGLNTFSRDMIAHGLADPLNEAV